MDEFKIGDRVCVVDPEFDVENLFGRVGEVVDVYRSSWVVDGKVEEPLFTVNVDDHGICVSFWASELAHTKGL